MKCNVLEYLEEAAALHPEKTAFADKENSISYAGLLEAAKRAGSFMNRRGCSKNGPVAVVIDRNIKSLILFLGAVYSGNFYVPLDMGMPVQRIRLILDSLKPGLIVSAAESAVWEREEIFSYEETQAEPADEEMLREIRERSIDTDPLYAIFTSGSTGVPKGVLVSHRSVIDLAEQFSDTFPFPQEPVFGNQAPFDFDVSVKDIYCCLKLSGTLEVIPKQLFSFPIQLIPYLNERRINVLIWAVSALRIVANFRTLEKCVPEGLKLIMFSGEVMPVKVLNYWNGALPEAVFVNLYGPTEITCNCSYYIVDRHFEKEESLPIGGAFRNAEVFLLDPENNGLITEKEEGRTGEICVRGTCLGLGYYNNPARTAEAFVQNPLNKCYPEKIYRTGDLGRYGKDGALYFTARKDFQIKHMGHRIELGEIETAVNALEFIDAACCVYDEGKEKIILCYQSAEACDKRIVEELAKRLPKFMWPNRYQWYDRLPLNKNAKTDRVLLKERHCGIT